MNFESLITVLVILFIIAGQIGKLFFSKNKETATKAGGWKNIIKNAATRIQDEFQPAVIESDDSQKKTIDSASEYSDEVQFSKNIEKAEVKPLVIKPEIIDDIVEKQKKPDIPRHLSHSDLKKVVIWSEILGTPTGLKDEHDFL